MISFIRSKKQLNFKQYLFLASKTVHPINHWLTIDCSSKKIFMWILLISQRLKVVCHLFAITGFVLNHIIMRKFRNTWMLNVSVKMFNKSKQFEWFRNLQQKLIIGHSFVIRNYISVLRWNRLKQTNCKSKKLIQHANVIYYYNRVRIYMHGIIASFKVERYCTPIYNFIKSVNNICIMMNWKHHFIMAIRLLCYAKRVCVQAIECNYFVRMDECFRANSNRIDTNCVDYILSMAFNKQSTKFQHEINRIARIVLAVFIYV